MNVTIRVSKPVMSSGAIAIEIEDIVQDDSEQVIQAARVAAELLLSAMNTRGELIEGD